MRVVYIGMFDEVIVPEWVDERGYPKPPVKRGEAVDVDDALAVRLLEQEGNWAIEEKPRSASPAHAVGNTGSGSSAAEE